MFPLAALIRISGYSGTAKVWNQTTQADTHDRQLSSAEDPGHAYLGRGVSVNCNEISGI